MNWIGGLSNVNGEFPNEDCAYLIEEVVITKKKPEAISQSISDGPVSAWNGLFGIGNLGSSGGGSSGIGGNGGGWGSPGGGMSGGGAPSPIKLRPVDDIEKQMNRKQQLEYQRLQNSKIDDIATGLGINMNLKEGLTDLAKKIANGNIGKSGENFLKSTKILGKATGWTGVYIAWIDYQNNPTTANRIKLGASIGLAALRINPFLSIGIGILDISGGTDWLYNQAGNYWDEN